MSILTHSSRPKLTARAISPLRSSAAASFFPINEVSSAPVSAALDTLKTVSASPQFSATPRFRVLMAMEPVRLNSEEEVAHRFFESYPSHFEFRRGTASLSHHWEKLGFAINFIAIVTAIAYVMFT